MKIGNCGGSERVTAESLKSRGTSAASGKDFQEILQGEMAGVEDADDRAPRVNRASADVAIVTPVLSKNPESLDHQTWPAVPEIDRLDGVLREVSNQLGGGGVALRQIGECLESLRRESESLTSFVEKLPPGHPLVQLGEDLRVFSNVESIKWMRGDYA